MTDVESTAVKEAAYVVSFGFFFPNRFPASVRFQETRVLHNVQVDVVEVSPAGLNPMELWVDRNSHSILNNLRYGQVRADFSDFRKLGAVTVPFVTTDTSDQSVVRTETLRFERTGAIDFSPRSLHLEY
jgi:hypothetical protein